MTISHGQVRSAISGSLFPLRLSDFEFYMLSDDRPTHPMVFVMVVHVSGALTESCFRDSLTELVTSNMLLNCRIEKVDGKSWCWTPITTTLDVLQWNPAADEIVRNHVPRVCAIDIHNQRGIQVQVLAGSDRSQVVIYLHHACCDGIAALQLVGELFARYGQKTAAPDAKRPEFDLMKPEVLRQRENYETGAAASQRQKKSLTRVIGKVARLLLRAPVMLAGSNDRQKNDAVTDQANSSSGSTINSLAIQSRVLPKAIHRSLRGAALQLGVSINDLFICEMTLQIRDWNRRAGLRSGRRWIRLAIPLSMRTGFHESMPAANVVSYALITRREQDCDDPAELLRSIHQQTSDVLFNREGIVCLKLFRVLRMIPGAMKLFLSFKTVLSTMVLANIGDVRRRFNGRFPLQKGRWIAGNVLIEQIHGVAPVRPNTRAAMSIGDYAGDLSISLRTDGEILNEDDSLLFLNEFLDRLQTLANQAGHVADKPDDSSESD